MSEFETRRDTFREALSRAKAGIAALPEAPSGHRDPIANSYAGDLDHLASLSPIEYGRVRKATAKRLGVAIKYLDEEVSARKTALTPAATNGAGQRLLLPEIEPATDPVNGDLLLAGIVSTLERFVVLPPHGAIAVALWIIRAHADDCFDTNPRLSLLSPEKRCGKTTLLELVARLVPRPLSTSNVTPSVVFRTIEAAHPTLLIDEVDSFTDAHEELRGILNSGHRRDTARVIRNVGDDHEPRASSTWAPMVLAAIGHLPSTIEDRSVIVPMRRRAPGETVERLRWTSKTGEAVKGYLRGVARGIARWVFDHVLVLKQVDPVIPGDLTSDRAADNWSPLLAIAEVIGGGLAGTGSPGGNSALWGTQYLHGIGSGATPGRHQSDRGESGG